MSTNSNGLCADACACRRRKSIPAGPPEPPRVPLDSEVHLSCAEDCGRASTKPWAWARWTRFGTRPPDADIPAGVADPDIDQRDTFHDQLPDHPPDEAGWDEAAAARVEFDHLR